MSKEKKDNIYKYTKRLFKDTRNQVISAEDSYYGIKDEDTCRLIKENLERKYSENIALLIFLDAYSDGYNFSLVDLNSEELINLYAEKYQKQEFMLGLETNNKADIINSLIQIISKYSLLTTSYEIDAAKAYADKRIKPILNISCDEAVLAKRRQS